VSSAYEKALQVINDRYDPARYNIYPFHFSDGDNYGSEDNRRCIGLVKELLKVSNAFGYGDIRHGENARNSDLRRALTSVDDPRFIPVDIHKKTDILPALRTFFAKTPSREGAVDKR
jgi:uncharacterized sporulation protein YeaH/YhbH (DUF444 family)